jgi:hypothetical protein
MIFCFRIARLKVIIHCNSAGGIVSGVVLPLFTELYYTRFISENQGVFLFLLAFNVLSAVGNWVKKQWLSYPWDSGNLGD